MLFVPRGRAKATIRNKKSPSFYSRGAARCECSNIILLLVAVAELAAKGIHQVAEDLVLASEAKGNAVSERHFGARRRVVESRGAVDGVLAALNVKRLPDGPHAVDLGVVKEEDGVVRRGVEVLHLGGATTEPVAGTVDTESVVAVEALHLSLEVLDVSLAKKKLGDIGVGVVTATEEHVEIADEAARVEVVAVLHVVVVRAVKRTKVAKDLAREGTGGCATATSARREGHTHETEEGIVTAADVGAVTAHRELVTVEELTLVGSVSISSPVPVGEVASVTALVDEIVLPLPDVVTVPGQEIGSDVDVHRQVNVGGNVLVVARLHPRVSVGVDGGRKLLQAHDGIGEALAVLVRHLSELGTHAGVLVGAATVELALLQALVGDLGGICEGIATLDLGRAVVSKGGDVCGRERSSGAGRRRDGLRCGGRDTGGESGSGRRRAADNVAGGRVDGGTVVVRGVRVRSLSGLSRGLDRAGCRAGIVTLSLGGRLLLGSAGLGSVEARSAVGGFGRKTRPVGVLEVLPVVGLVGGRRVARHTTVVALAIALASLSRSLAERGRSLLLAGDLLLQRRDLAAKVLHVLVLLGGMADLGLLGKDVGRDGSGGSDSDGAAAVGRRRVGVGQSRRKGQSECGLGVHDARLRNV